MGRKVIRPIDTVIAIEGHIQKFKNAATNVGEVAGELKKNGRDLRLNWWGAAERMTSREIEAAGGFFTKLSTSFDEAHDALVAYKGEIVRVNGELDKLQTKLTEEDNAQFTLQPGYPLFPTTKPSTSASPSPSTKTTEPLFKPYFKLLPDPDPRNTTILKSLNEPATKAATKIRSAAEHIAKGSGAILTINIGADLPFQRSNPLVPGPGATPSGMPGDVNSTTKSDSVKELQELLQARGWRIPVTGNYDDRTRQVVAMFQREKGLHPAKFGQVDQATWDAIWTRKITGWN